MPLPAHVVHTAAGLPVDEATRPEIIEFGAKLLRAQNVRQPQRGSVLKRDGFAAMALPRFDGSTPTSAYKMFADRNSVVRVADAEAEAFSTKAQAWAPMGRVPEATARIIDLPSMGDLANLEDIDATNGYVAVSWLVSVSFGVGDAYIAVIDQATGATVRAPEIVGTSTTYLPSLLAVQGNYFITVRYDFAGTMFEAWYLDTTSASTIEAGWTAFAAPLCTDATGAFAVHSLPHATTPRVAVLYVNDSGGADQLTLLSIDITGVVQSDTIPTSGVLPTSCSLGGNSTDTLWLIWNEALNVRAMGVDPFTITTPLATVATVRTTLTGCDHVFIAPSSVAGKARFSARETATAPGRTWMQSIQTVAGATTLDGSHYALFNASMVRKPFFYEGRYYAAFTWASVAFPSENPQNNFFICDWTETVGFVRPVANIAPGLASAGLNEQGKIVVDSTTSSLLYVGLSIKRSGVAEGSAMVALDFVDTRRWQAASLGNSTFIAGGLLSYSDGVRIAEAGFLGRPTQPTTALSGAGITGTYRYVCVYEEVDADGNWCISGLSDPSASVSPANDTVTVSTSTLTVSSRFTSVVGSRSSLRVAFYRTLTGGVAPYYRLGTTVNDYNSLSIDYVDTTTDAILATAPKLYSQPGVLGTSQDRRAPPHFQCITVYNGMLVGASGSDVWYSGQSVSGEATWFNPLFQVPIPGDGDITALAVLDGTLLAFKRRETYALSGEAPSDNGTSGGLGSPRRLACDVGCIDSRTPCTTALGVFFQSERGIEILTRAQSVEWIGEPYIRTLEDFPVCTSITVEPVSNTVLVELAESEALGLVSGDGCTLVYDLSLRNWVSKDIRTAQDVLGRPSQSACMVYTGTAWRYAWLSTDGRVFFETPGTSLDDGAWITALYETAHCKHGLQQQQMVWAGKVLFEQLTAAGLKIEVAYDFTDYSAANDKVWTEAQTLGRRQLEWRPKPRGTAMRFRVSDVEPATPGTGKGFVFVGMSMDAAPMQGSTTGTTRLDPAGRK